MTSENTVVQARLDMIGIVAADLAESLAFYRLLGVDVPAGAESEPHVEVTLPGGLRLAWDLDATVRSFHPHWSGVGGGRIALASRVPGPAEVDETFQLLTAGGGSAQVAPFDAFWGQRYAVVADPDGNTIELFAPAVGSS